MSYSFIVSTKNAASSSTTTAVNTTNANLIIVATSYLKANAPTFIDNQGNTWSTLTLVQSSSYACQVYYSFNPITNSNHTFTGGPAGNFPAVIALAFKYAGYAPLDLQNGASTTGTSLQPGSITPSINDCLLISGIVYAGGSNASINDGYAATTIDTDFAVYFSGGLAYKIQTEATISNPTWSWTGSVEAAAKIASFKPDTGFFSLL